jgi:hypothetical protein
MQVSCRHNNSIDLKQSTKVNIQAYKSVQITRVLLSPIKLGGLMDFNVKKVPTS